MNRPLRVLWITFIESFATICVERGVYFLAHEHLNFTAQMNLYLALAFGVTYVVGALASHKTALRFSERSLLLACLTGMFVCHVAMATWIHPVMIFAGTTALGAINGMKWPVLESYVGAGLTPKLSSQAIGRFNIAWSSAVPLCLVAAGPLINYDPRAIFLVPAALNVVSLLLALPVARHPAHIADDHPDRPTSEQMPRYRALLASNRWLLLSSFSLMFVLAALLPEIFSNLGYDVEKAPGLSGVIDFVRMGAFILLLAWSGWHSRLWPIILPLIGLPAGFLLVMYGQSLTVVLAGEVIFGASAGLSYFSALYYAMVVKNASVDAGGAHEALIGVGFAAGPAAGLIGFALMPVLNSRVLGTIAGVGPLLAACSVGAVYFLVKALKAHR